jgi:B12-binding domain/radical SAM domain protein of rhizo-twelve system
VKLGVDAVVVGECEDVLPQLARPREQWKDVPSLAVWDDGAPRANGPTHTVDMQALPALEWPDSAIAAHHHHHHRFDRSPQAPGAEMEASRGCPYHCSFCAKDNFRNAYRKRPVPTILVEIDRLIAKGVEYVYFIDEIFLPNRDLLEALVRRPVQFGVQTRIDLWPPELLDLLGRAGCVSIEAGVESITPEGRNLLDKNSRLTTEQITERLLRARDSVPFVQANLIDASTDDPEEVEAWRSHLVARGVWANKPVPMFPYPGSPDYAKRWGAPDDQAWERAHAFYLEHHHTFSDIQDDRPLPLGALELSPPCRTS